MFANTVFGLIFAFAKVNFASFFTFPKANVACLRNRIGFLDIVYMSASQQGRDLA